MSPAIIPQLVALAVVIVDMIVWQIWCITRADHPTLQAFETPPSSSRPESGQLSGLRLQGSGP